MTEKRRGVAERVAHFEIATKDPERAAAFYRDVFGWSIDKWDGPADYWLVTSGDGPGIDGGIMGPAFDQPVINTVLVEGALEGALDRVTKAGGAPRSAVNTIPGVGRHIYVADPDGTVFGLMEPEPR